MPAVMPVTPYGSLPSAARVSKMYCTVDDLQKQVSSDVLQRVAGDGEGNLLADVVDYGISQAAAEIDAYCSRYGVPLKSVPEVLRKYCVDMALFHIFSRQGFSFKEESEDYIIYLRYKMAIAFLEKVAGGKVDLPISSSSSGSAVSGSGTSGTANLRLSSNQRLFTREQMKGY